jgi:hypothetical protein
MEELSTFDRLVRELSLHQRKEMLARIERSAKISDEPLIGPLPEQTHEDIKEAYVHLSLWKKFLLFLKSLFAGKKREELLEEMLLNRLKKEITHQISRCVDFKYSLFLEEMKKELEELAQAANFFKEAMLKCLGKEKTNFIAFLGSFELAMTHEHLLSEINPQRIAIDAGGLEEGNIKIELEKRLRDILGTIPEGERENMYLESQALHYLFSFCTFSFEDILDRFNYNHFKVTLSCEFSDILKRLADLAEIMQSVVVPPTVTALKALFLYYHEENLDERDFNLGEQLTEDFKRAEEALVKIRIFNKRIPLLALLKVIKKNYYFAVTPLKGGEDWLALYKNYWLNKLNFLYREYITKRKILEIEEKALQLLETKEFPELKYYHPKYYTWGFVVRHWRSLCFLLGFTRSIFPNIFLRPLKILLLNGEFYKDANRMEFSDSFNYLTNLAKTLATFENKLIPPGGEYAVKIEEVTKNQIEEKAELKNIQMLFAKIDNEARIILDDTITHLQSLKLIINGILYSEIGGKYDTISNIGYIGGRENQFLLKEWEKILHLITKIHAIINEMRAIESETPLQ